MIRRLFVLGVVIAGLSAAISSMVSRAVADLERSDKGDFEIVTVAGGLERPWGLAFLPDGRMLVTERPGRLRIVSADGSLSEPVAGLPKVAATGQGGMLDVALDPDFANNQLIYLSFNEPGRGGSGTAVLRGRLVGQQLEDPDIIFRMDPKLSGGRHFGSRLVFLPDGTLLVSLGDRARQDRAQDLSNHQGTVVRINPDGTIPDDNPFKDREGARPEIYSYGHRNVHGLIRDPETGTVWAHEYGALGGDELNILQPGANYGWPAVTHSRNYSGTIISRKTEAPGIEPPVTYWTPSISPSGMTVYRGDKFPQWQGDIFVGALTPGHLRRLGMEGKQVASQETLLEGVGSRIRDVRTGPDGYIYVLTDSRDGRLLRLEPAS
jgi:glucose/arabinose dehydrogenase